MTNTNEISYECLKKLFSTQNHALSAAETHGFITGMIVAGLRLDSNEMSANLQQILNESAPLSKDLASVLKKISSNTFEQLETGLLQLNLMIEDDQQTLAVRLKSVAEWADGWLLGFGHHSTSNNLPNDSLEALRDIRNISQVDFEIDPELNADDIDELERSYVEIIEHLKVTVEMLYLDNTKISKQTEAPLSSGSIH